MNWSTWWLFLVTETSLSLTPGPAVLLVVSSGLRNGGVRSIFSSLGILAANALYFAISATSLGAVLVASYRLFSAIRWIGTAYLVWCGLAAILGKHSVFVAAAPEKPAAVSNARLFANGFALQAANPKAMLFFAVLLPQFIEPKMPVAWQMLILGVTSVVSEFFILLAYGMLAGRASVWAREPRFVRAVDWVSGLMLIGAAIGLALVD